MDFLISLVLNILFRLPPVQLILYSALPALVLFFWVRKKDRLEPEPPKLLRKLAGLGALSVIPAFLLELAGMSLLRHMPQGQTWDILHMFLIVGLTEELCKFSLLWLATWKEAAFNCSYDGVVYAAAVSAGFAVAENVLYGLRYGVGVLYIRAVTSIPGHICFGVLMGVLYGLAKKEALRGSGGKARRLAAAALFFPALTHGFYDIIADAQQTGFSFIFLVFLAALYVSLWFMVTRASGKDRYL